MLAIVCPGQGSQTPGVLTPWLENDDAASARLADYSEYAGTDLRAHGTTSDEETLRNTAVAQPLIVACSLLSAHALGLTPERLAELGEKVLVSGHSVGEIPAAALAGALTDQQALELIAVRAAAMAEAAAAEPTGMAAVLGGAEDEVLHAIDAAGLTPANINGAGQIVAAGAQTGIDQLCANPPARARTIPLKVAGAFHTHYMAPAQQALAAASAASHTADAAVPLLSNRDGAAVRSGSEIMDRIVDQVTRPVCWDACMDSMRAAGVTGILELLPGGTLTGLAKRGLKGTKTFAVKSPEDLSAAADFIAEHTA
ncbi:ACP S-malonyltransferase [Nesterenkonia sphaerica]|uniref:[acyl-carrier-protein] S-malonyltransferase n=1 Tax=Nesterenkonia sphaerica TaxID=1804988 RepID=A0A5R9AL81_9MICC|nr:ACP S-malonyltransferase [Nesterenkonia sphaerica]TLP79353.1 ACP S-malonyltransferase [Nesterenkonia sphaerica]